MHTALGCAGVTKDPAFTLFDEPLALAAWFPGQALTYAQGLGKGEIVTEAQTHRAGESTVR